MNLYVLPDEIKAMLVDAQLTSDRYDAALYRMSLAISRLIERATKRVFYPYYEARYFDGALADGATLWIDEIMTIDEVAESTDGGSTYTALAVTDYAGALSGSFAQHASYNQLVLLESGTRSAWAAGQRAVRVTGWWGYAGRDNGWEDTGLTLGAAMSSGDATFDCAGAASTYDVMGDVLALVKGRLIRVGDEMMEVGGVTAGEDGDDDVVAVTRGQNGSAAAEHDAGVAVSLWRAPMDVCQAAIIQVVRQWERAQQGFGEARATGEIGQLFWVKAIDPEALGMLKGLMRTAV